MGRFDVVVKGAPTVVILSRAVAARESLSWSFAKEIPDSEIGIFRAPDMGDARE